MEHAQVLTFFHEMGHLMHHLLSSKHRWVTLSGINCEWDFVETPSQLLEEWGWDTNVLKRFARHYETGEPIHKDLVEQMRQADEFGKGVYVMRQIFYAALSFTYHSRDPTDLDLLRVMREIQRGYSPFPYEEDTWAYASFDHLIGYSSMYYSYMWSLVLAKDLFTKFKANGLMDKETAKAYRRAILEPGGALDAMEMVRNFLGRDYSFEAFKVWLEEERQPLSIRPWQQCRSELAEIAFR
jgi:thimet oligopeptidase